MGRKTSDETFGTEEAAWRREAALKRRLSTPHKPHSELKLGKPRKERPASKGRVHKGRTRD